MKLLVTTLPIQVNINHQWSEMINHQVFTLRRWMWCRRSDTQPSSPPLSKPWDAVHSNSCAAQRFVQRLHPRPRTLLYTERQQWALTSDWQEERPAGSWSGCGGPAGQEQWIHVDLTPGCPPLTPPTCYLKPEGGNFSCVLETVTNTLSRL